MHNFYNNASESGIRRNDPDLNINWKIDNPILSDRDKALPYFKELNAFY